MKAATCNIKEMDGGWVLPSWLSGKESTCNVGDLGSIPGLRRSPGEGNGYPLQYSGLENSLDCKEIQPVHSKGDQSWVFIGRIDVEAKTPILWPPDEKG